MQVPLPILVIIFIEHYRGNRTYIFLFSISPYRRGKKKKKLLKAYASNPASPDKMP